ncbi:EamA family transporter [Prevotella intermedia ATCC 25611 = DSM 20706]|uniref:DMT family transporter n=1 Tax=Prevotella intermedia TaxID=28131 RepID=UPI00048E5FF4|nr:DMT family transporter [Prevotella intermedia]APW31790.1 EamA family transporter [Prevotella intermedia ATCC 25611 = DSM 20706]SUB96328.1 aromatic amino acid exporter [Prevotella intermedia]
MPNTVKESKNRVVLYHLIAILVVSIWGATLVNTKVVIQGGMRPDEVFLSRYIIAYLAMWTLSYKRLWSANIKDELLMVACGILGGSLYFIPENFAVQVGSVNDISFILCTSPLFTMFLAILFCKEKLTKSLAIGSIIALIGVSFIIFGGNNESSTVTNRVLGDALALLSTACFGAYCLLLRPLGQKYGAAFLTRKMFFYGALTSIPLFIITPWHYPVENFLTDLPVTFNLLFLGLVASFFCFGAWSYVTEKVGAVKIANYNYLSPICTVIISAIFLGEKMTMEAAIGSVLILIGVFFANKK